MAEGIVAAMARGYRDPRAEMARQVDEGLTEARALAHLFLACALGFVASLPQAVRKAQALGDVPDPLAGTVSAHLFGYIFVAPLMFYGLAAVVHLVARAFGGRGGFLGARSALFWAALLGAPIALALALVGVGVEVAGGGRWLPWVAYLGFAGLAFWLWLLAASLAETEGFAATRRVAAALAVIFVAFIVGFGTLTHAASVFG